MTGCLSALVLDLRRVGGACFARGFVPVVHLVHIVRLSSSRGVHTASEDCLCSSHGFSLYPVSYNISSSPSFSSPQEERQAEKADLA